jgi:hypothetical protein
MQLPFTHDQFLGVFASYNRALWPGAVLLWIATVVVVVSWLKSSSGHGVGLPALLAIHWAWSGIAYHAVFFRRINPAALWFAAFFVLEGVLFAWLGVVRRRLTFQPVPGTRRVLALILVAYALAYPLLGLGMGLSYPRMPSFGVPCPTTILTSGLLLLLDRDHVRVLGVIPLLWAAVGGSAAFGLGIRADLMLVVGGLLLAAALLAPGALRPRAAAASPG